MRIISLKREANMINTYLLKIHPFEFSRTEEVAFAMTVK